MPKFPDPKTGLLDPDDSPFRHCSGVCGILEVAFGGHDVAVVDGERHKCKDDDNEEDRQYHNIASTLKSLGSVMSMFHHGFIHALKYKLK